MSNRAPLRQRFVDPLFQEVDASCLAFFLCAAVMEERKAGPWPGIVEYATSGEVTMHWSRAALASLLIVVVAMHAATTFLLNMMMPIEFQRGRAALIWVPERLYPASRGTAG